MVIFRTICGGFLSLVLGTSAVSLGADLPTTLQGRVEEVKDPPSGIQGVEVEVLDAKGKSLKTALTDPKGSYTVHGLPRGASVSIYLRLKGYKDNPTILAPVKLHEETTTAPKADMVKSQGNDAYYSGVAREVHRRLQAHPADAKVLYNLLDSLGSAERAVVNDKLRVYAVEHNSGVNDSKLREVQGAKATAAKPPGAKATTKTTKATPPPGSKTTTTTTAVPLPPPL
jgi:hypothetical protein